MQLLADVAYPTYGQNLPAGQSVHVLALVAPVAAEYLPAAQPVQFMAPAAAE